VNRAAALSFIKLPYHATGLMNIEAYYFSLTLENQFDAIC